MLLLQVVAVEDDQHTSGYHNSVRKMLQDLLRKLTDAKVGFDQITVVLQLLGGLRHWVLVGLRCDG